MEIDDELAYKIHGIIHSESDSDSDGTTEFDEVYNLLKPPAYDYELIKDKIIIISSQTPKVLNDWHDHASKIKNNDIGISNVNTENTKLKNLIQVESIEVQLHKRTNTGRENVDLDDQTSFNLLNDSNYLSNFKAKSRNSKKPQNKGQLFRKSGVTGDNSKNVNRRKENLGFNIKSIEELEKEFPSLDEVCKNNLSRKHKIIRTERSTSNSTFSEKKKKTFKPLPIEITYSKDISNIEHGKKYKKNSKREVEGSPANKINFNVLEDENKMNNHKRKVKNKSKQSIKAPINKNLVDTGINKGTKMVIEMKNDNTIKMKDIEVLANDVVVQEIENVKLKFEDSIPNKEIGECESSQANDMSKEIQTINLMDSEEEYITEIKCVNTLEDVKMESQHNENLVNLSEEQQENRNFSETNVDMSFGDENSSKNCKLELSKDHGSVEQYENIFDEEFRNFVQDIIYEGASITDLNSFTYEQLHLAYTAYVRKNATKSSPDKVENPVRSKSSQKKKPTKKKKKVKQPSVKLRHYDKLYQQYKNDSEANSVMKTDLGTVHNEMSENEGYFFKDAFEEYNIMSYQHASMYKELIEFMAYKHEMQYIYPDGNTVIYVAAVNINQYLGMNSLTYISNTISRDKKSYICSNKQSHSNEINRKIKHICCEFGSMVLNDLLLHAISQLF